MSRDRALDLAAEAYPALAEAALVDRRMALKLMGASAALAAASGCSAPGSSKKVVAGPPPRNIATTLEQDGLGFGVVVRTANGNPVKIEGHPQHVASLGRSNVFAQAALLTHYDPERLRSPVIGGRAADWEAARALLAGLPRDGAGVHILIEPAASPTLERMLQRAREALPAARFYQHRALPLTSQAPPDFSADTIVSFGDDFLGPGPMQVANAAAWAEARRRGRESGRVPQLIVVESVPSLTGARADLRIAASPAEMTTLAEAVRDGTDARIARALAEAERVDLRLGAEMADDVRQAARRAGEPWRGRNAATSPRLFNGGDMLPLDELSGALNAGAVETLLILGGDPLYSAPGRLRLGERLQRAVQVIYLGSRANATARVAQHRLPEKSMLARWGDLRAFDGSVSLVRPVTREAGLTAIELLALIAGERPDGQALVRATHGLVDTDPDTLAGGILIPGTGPGLPAVLTAPAPLPLPLPQPQSEAGFALIFRPSAHVRDGTLADNAWAQELPDPITGLAWGNAATLAPEDAERLGIEDGDEIRVTAGGASLNAPAKRLAGQAPGTIGLTLGYGHGGDGVGSGIGYDANVLFDGARVREGASIEATGRRLRLIYPNKPFRPNAKDAVRWVSPGGAVERAPSDTPGFVRPEYRGTKQWGMAIDLDACIGCNACTIACQAENNVPVVGPDEVAAGRVMHWIRVDRHEGPNGVTAHQPVPCMHCETAPCEPVCPVEATSHSSEGLNQMTYQRCVGTRSCSNNCPYKVRRFNWFDYANDGAIPEAGQNPRVHIRDKGVMEKCTYCVQRIEDARTDGGDEAPVTACQQACPTQAIVFGDIADPGSTVAQARGDRRGYALLDGLNLKPRTTYLARVKADG